MALTRSTNGAEEDRIMFLEAFQPTLGDILPRFLVRLGTPVVVLELELEIPGSGAQCFQYLDTGFDHLWSDTVGGDTGDAVVSLRGDCYG